MMKIQIQKVFTQTLLLELAEAKAVSNRCRIFVMQSCSSKNLKNVVFRQEIYQKQK
jgi:hypothetical protein